VDFELEYRIVEGQSVKNPDNFHLAASRNRVPGTSNAYPF
jgi:hypothetical protein